MAKIIDIQGQKNKRRPKRQDQDRIEEQAMEKSHLIKREMLRYHMLQTRRDISVFLRMVENYFDTLEAELGLETTEKDKAKFELIAQAEKKAIEILEIIDELYEKPEEEE